ncbi:MAG TPA: hypothetical protein VMH22_12520 [bacterium]|nr:hypothetical protein [bacterium]
MTAVFALLLAAGIARAGNVVDNTMAHAQYMFDHRYVDSAYTDSAWYLAAAVHSLAPDNEKGLSLWAQVNVEMGDDSRTNVEREHYYRLAELGAETLRTRFPEDPAGHFWWAAAHGERMLVQGIPEAMLALPAVVREMERTVELDSSFVFPYAVLGMLYRDLPLVAGGSYVRSRLYFETGLRHAPNFTLLGVELARLDAKEGRYSEARTRLQDVLECKSPLYEAAYLLNDKPEADSMLAALHRPRSERS